MQSRINRIRLEFKVFQADSFFQNRVVVLIESDWNLKMQSHFQWSCSLDVLIESDWNLKFIEMTFNRFCPNVLIESDWNLKFDGLRPGRDLPEY